MRDDMRPDVLWYRSCGDADRKERGDGCESCDRYAEHYDVAGLVIGEQLLWMLVCCLWTIRKRAGTGTLHL